MAACSYGGSISNLRLSAARIEPAGSRQPLHGIKLPNFTPFSGLVLSQRSSYKGSNRCLCLAAKNAQWTFLHPPAWRFAYPHGPLIVTSHILRSYLKTSNSYSWCGASTNSEAWSEVANSSESTSQLIPNALEVESLLNEICDTTSIAEFELKLGGFRLHVMRDLTGESTSLPPPLSASIVDATPDPPELNGSASSPSLAITKAAPTSGGVQTLDKAADEGLAIIYSPRVGYFRRSRTIKGKKAPPPCKEKQIVKEGQVVCYIEQLGGELPIESDVAGEVVKILCEDGDAVGYGDALIAILPSFPGIKKLQ